MVKTIKSATEEEAEMIMQRKEEGRRRRSVRNHTRNQKGKS